ncbi:hypothetical protein [Tellurirhabdus rosea]|uniref:hypothetical protein n=1 Tax=Tellurirhabdus rosea TaxID=2674997 RepID=UPI002252D21F|nr:hypothetical protein [Tellurirhabdus rosea]
MISKRFWIGLGLLALLAAGYFGYRRWTQPIRSTWELIPSDALVVMESPVLQDTVSKKARLGQMTLRYTPVFHEAVQALDQFVWTPLDTADALRFLRRKPIWYSLHRIARDKLDFLFYIPIRTAEDRALVDRLLKPDADRFRVLAHPYQGERIRELLTVGNQSLGSFLVLDDFLVGSPSTLLIESVVRRIHQPFAETPLQRADVKLVRPHTLGGMYIRSSVLESLLTTPVSQTTDWQTRSLRAFLPTEIKTQFRASANRTHLIGTSREDIGTQTALARLFAGQTPGRIGCGALVPESATSLFHIGLTDGMRFGEALTPFINSEEDPTFRQGRRKLRPLLQKNAANVYRFVGSEIALVRLDAPSSERRLVLLIRSENPEKLSDRYQLASFLLNGSKAVSSARPFLKHNLTRITTPDLPAYLFGGLFRGFPTSWVTQEGPYLVIANSQEVMQEYLQALRDEQVWTANRRQSELLSQTLRPAHFTVFTRFDRAGESMSANWPLAWQRLLNHDETTLDNVENLVYQSSYSRDHIYSTIAVGRTTRRASEAVFNRVFLQKKIEFNAPPTSTPFVLGDFVGGTGYLWAIDNIRQFVQITPEGEKQILPALDGPVRSSLVPVNYLDNGRLQYAFTTDRSLYFADPANGLVKFSSVRLPEGLDPSTLRAVRHPSLLLLAGHRDGSVYGFSKAEKRFTRQFAVNASGEGRPPFQAVSRRQALTVLSVQKEGRVFLWYENGTRATGFPVDLKAEMVGPAFIDSGSPATLTTITQQGELVRIGEDGQEADRTQLYRPIRRGSFRLLLEEGQTDYLLLRATDTEIAVLDQNGRQLFEVRSLISGQTTIRYHALDAGLKIISVKSGTFTTLYDLAGHPIGDRPIPALYPVTLQYSASRNKLFVYGSSEKAVQVWSIKLR